MRVVCIGEEKSNKSREAVGLWFNSVERSMDFGSSTAKSFLVIASFHGDLVFFVRAKDSLQPVRRVLTHKTSVKDVIESFGVPHPEVDLIVFNGQPVDFSFRLETDTALDVY